MKKRFMVGFLCLFVLLVNTCFAETSLSDPQMFTPTLPEALHIKNWLSNGVNRALLAFTLGANAADDKIMGRADVLLAFMQNPTYVGKETNSNNLVAATVTENDFVVIYYSPSESSAAVATITNNNGITLGGIQLESVVSQVCSEYYQIDADDMETGIKYIQSQLN